MLHGLRRVHPSNCPATLDSGNLNIVQKALKPAPQAQGLDVPKHRLWREKW